MIQTIFDNSIREMTGGDFPKKKFLIGVSGGIDSMCLADLFLHSSLHLSFSVAHVNFSLRPGDCDLDQALVQEWAKENDIVCHHTVFDTISYSREHSISVEMAARELRYGWFDELIREYGYDYLAIAHNLNDKVETLFINLLRGTGLKGLTGIKGVNGKIIRPLIEMSRDEIVKYVSDHSVRYRDDITNFQSRYSRNKIRNIIFPEFAKINPSFLKTINREMFYFHEAQQWLEEYVLSLKGTLYEMTNDEMIIHIPKLETNEHRSLILYHILNLFGFNSSQVAQIESGWDNRTGKMFRSISHELVFDRDLIRVYPIPDGDKIQFQIDGPGAYSFNNHTFFLEIFPLTKDFSPVASSGQLFLDADRVPFPLICRSWRQADRFRPFGMNNGTKKLSDYYTDQKMSKKDKDSQPLLCSESEEKIVCLPCLKIDDRYKITSSTKNILHIFEDSL